MAKRYTLLGRHGTYVSLTKGTLGGNGAARIYGRLDCPAATRAVAQGDSYQEHRVFFADEATAIGCGYRPCGTYMKAEYAAWRRDRDRAGPAGRERRTT